jgi:hypothetical protein
VPPGAVLAEDAWHLVDDPARRVLRVAVDLQALAVEFGLLVDTSALIRVASVVRAGPRRGRAVLACREGRIASAVLFGRAWMIAPSDVDALKEASR